MTKNLSFEFKHTKLLDETKFRIVFMDHDINIAVKEDPDHIHQIYDSLTHTLIFFSARSKHLIKLINFNALIIKDHGHQVEEEKDDVMVSSVFSIPETLPNQFLIDSLKNCVLANGHLNTTLQHLLLQYIFAPTEEEKELVLNALFEMFTLSISCYYIFKNHEHVIKVLPIDDIINIINKDSMIFGKHIRRYLVNEIDGEKMFYIQPIKSNSLI